MNTTAVHASDDILERYAMGTLSGRESAPVEEHLLLCTVCQERLEDLDGFIQVAKVALEVSAQSSPTSRKYRFPLQLVGVACRSRCS
jgi:anti-sigma factor ChrR (cupin superfamily)